MDLYTITKTLHIGAGTLALAGFWTAGLARKGGALHVRVGQIYLVAMCVIMATGLVMAATLFGRGKVVSASFLSYLIVITAAASWSAWRAIRDKRDWQRFTGPVFRLLGALSFASGLVIFVLGYVRGIPLFMGFAFVGLFLGIGTWRDVRRGPEGAKWWLRQHYRAIMGNGVATHIAFLGIGLPRLFPELAGSTLQLISWFGPIVVAFAAALYWDRRHPTAVKPASHRNENAPA
ncbi:MAG TPA: hypothetical protein VN581_05770 [Patescibacteria group bacterium]|nr:hypothetical protein [Patescibacteria group bacterium]